MKTPVFYGWVIVAVSFLAMVGGTLKGAYGLTVLLVPMSVDLGWSRTAIIGASFTASVAAGVVSPILGRVVDRHGVRRTMVASALLSGITIMAIAWVSDLWLYYLIFGLVNGFSRPLVQTLGVSVAVANWWVKRRPVATAIVSMGIPVSGFIGIPITTFFVVQFGWRSAWVFLGLVIIVLVAIPTAIFMREKPEDMGLMPDGGVRPQEKVGHAGVVSSTRWWDRYQTSQEWEAREALHTRAFWVLALTPSVIALTGPMFATHVVAFWLDQGMNQVGAAAAASSFVLGTLAGRFFWGVVSSKVHIQYCYVLLGVIAFLGTVGIYISPTMQTIYLATMFFGIAGGGMMQLRLQVWPDYFGRKAIGSIRGYSAPFELVGFALGPLFAAWVFDATGSYQPALAIYAGLSAASAVTILLFGKPPTLESQF